MNGIFGSAAEIEELLESVPNDPLYVSHTELATANENTGYDPYDNPGISKPTCDGVA